VDQVLHQVPGGGGPARIRGEAAETLESFCRPPLGYRLSEGAREISRLGSGGGRSSQFLVCQPIGFACGEAYVLCRRRWPKLMADSCFALIHALLSPAPHRPVAPRACCLARLIRSLWPIWPSPEPPSRWWMKSCSCCPARSPQEVRRRLLRRSASRCSMRLSRRSRRVRWHPPPEACLRYREDCGKPTARRSTFLPVRPRCAERVAGWDYGQPDVFPGMLKSFGLLVASRGGDYCTPPPLSLRCAI